MKLSNLTEEEKIERKRQQRREAQKRYYKKHKEEIKKQKAENKEKYRYSEIYRKRINEALRYIDTKLFINKKELKNILNGIKNG